MAALSKLAHRLKKDRPLLVVTSTGALMQRLPPQDVVKKAGFSAKPDQDVDVADLERYFGRNGYSRASTVSRRASSPSAAGDRRLPAGRRGAVRLGLFGDTLETIRTFDPALSAPPHAGPHRPAAVSEVPDRRRALSPLPHRLRWRRFGAWPDDPPLRLRQRGLRRQGMEHWLPLFYERLDTLFAYLRRRRPDRLRPPGQEARDERLDAPSTDYLPSPANQGEHRPHGHYRPLPPRAALTYGQGVGRAVRRPPTCAVCRPFHA
jgi:transcription-repair coupling factor (superfamily II helicase)